MTTLSTIYQHKPSDIRPGRGILVVDPQGLGDVVCSIPLIKAICGWSCGRWPVYLILNNPNCFELIRGEGLDVVPIFMVPSYSGKRGAFRLWAELKNRIDLVIGLPEIAERKLVMLRYAIGARYLVAGSRPLYQRWMTSVIPQDWTQPFLEAEGKLARALGIETPLALPKITLSPAESSWADTTLTSEGLMRNDFIVGLHCASVVPPKRWPADRFGVVIRSLIRRFPNLAVISFGSKQERSASDQAHLVAGELTWLEGTGRWSVRESLAMLSRCDLFISGDTGLMHMAAAVGTKTLSIFGPTCPLRRAPLHTGGAAVFPRTECHPCYQGKWKPCNCVQLISPEVVAAMAENCLLGKGWIDNSQVVGNVGVIANNIEMGRRRVSCR